MLISDIPYNIIIHENHFFCFILYLFFCILKAPLGDESSSYKGAVVRSEQHADNVRPVFADDHNRHPESEDTKDQSANQLNASDNPKEFGDMIPLVFHNNILPII